MQIQPTQKTARLICAVIFQELISERILKVLKILKEGFDAIFLVFDSIELFIVFCSGTILFGFAIWQLVKAIYETGSILYMALFLLFLGVSVGSITRDIINRKIGNLSKMFLACWGICIIIAGWIWMS